MLSILHRSAGVVKYQSSPLHVTHDNFITDARLDSSTYTGFLVLNNEIAFVLNGVYLSFRAREAIFIVAYIFGVEVNETIDILGQTKAFPFIWTRSVAAREFQQLFIQRSGTFGHDIDILLRGIVTSVYIDFILPLLDLSRYDATPDDFAATFDRDDFHRAVDIAFDGVADGCETLNRIVLRTTRTFPSDVDVANFSESAYAIAKLIQPLHDLKFLVSLKCDLLLNGIYRGQSAFISRTPFIEELKRVLGVDTSPRRFVAN